MNEPLTVSLETLAAQATGEADAVSGDLVPPIPDVDDIRTTGVGNRTGCGAGAHHHEINTGVAVMLMSTTPETVGRIEVCADAP